MKILIFGTGRYYQKRKKNFKNVEIVAFVDNDKEKCGQILDGKPIISANEIKSRDYDYVCLAVKMEFAMQIRRQLKELGIPEEKILDFTEYGMLEGGSELKIYYGDSWLNMQGKKILLLTHQLSYTGAPLVLFYVATVLQKRGYAVTVLSAEEGELRKDYIKMGIMVAVKDNARMYDKVLAGWFQQFDLVWGNTVAFCNWVEWFGKAGIPFIWWLHEGEQIYRNFEQDRLPRNAAENVKVYAVGHKAKIDAEKYMPEIQIGEFLYGVSDFFYDTEKMDLQDSSEKTIFAIVGTICRRKAQDVLLDAIEMLTLEERKKIEVWIVGETMSMEQSFCEKILERSKVIPEVKIIGALKREEMCRAYNKIDVLVCPSREDPLPVVVVEAMVMEKPSIVSSNTGFVSLLADEENGLICEAGNVVNLCEKMQWCIRHKDKLKKLGTRAREVYHMKFSMEKFEENLCRIVEENIYG